LEAGRKVKLSREGSFLLRSLMWAAQLLKDPALTARVGEIAKVEFSPKKNGEKVVRAAGDAAGTSSPSPEPVVPGRMPDLDEITAQALARTISAKFAGQGAPAFGDRVRVDGTVIHVRGDLDSYRVHLSSGAVFRESDGHRVHVPVRDMQMGGMSDILQRILMLTRDSQHSGEFTSAPE